jgi:ABC-type transporter Mla subunit MlaD
MTRRPTASVVANPMLVGATTFLVTVVAVFLAYQANNGLPFVPTRELTVDLPNAQNLVRQNEVREGGERIGLVSQIDPVRLPGGRVGARLHLKLDRNTPGVPVDSTWAVRPRSALSLKYLELIRGHSRKTVPDNGHVGIARSNNPVELDQLLSTFDKRTREGGYKFLRGSSQSLYARGRDLNTAIGELPRFLRHLEPVMRTLGEPSTGLRRFFRELGDGARILAPIGEQWAASFTDGATTFDAISRDPTALEQTVAKTPPTLKVGTEALREGRPFLRDLAGYSSELERASREVRLALPPINHALGVGAPVQTASIPLSQRTDDTLHALSEVTGDPATSVGLRGLGATVDTLNTQLRFYGPYMTVCNNWNFFWTFAGEHLSELDPTGTQQRTISLDNDHQDNSYSNGGAVTPANGENLVEPNGTRQYFHAQPYAHAVDSQGNADCEVGQRGWPRSMFNKWGQAKRFERVISPSVPRTPGNQGANYAKIENGQGVGRGPSRVPPGETFTDEPETGARIP